MLKHLFEKAKNMDMSKVVWKYRGEGNANVVVSLPNQKRVLRIAKTGETSKTVESTESLESLCLTFYNKIMTRLLGESFVSPGQRVILSNSKSMESELVQIRPSKISFISATS